ncbi:hypothetical protein IWX76_003209 [Pedobacter sp. CAN_A7]|uniref:DUF6266 family protein n=1 Tax=Pedobacter sp. CAN_A7 TaxID=2787722 RepID=UPI0018CB35A3
MAKLKRGILGQLSGKIGPVVTSTWKNTVYVRAMPQRINDPKTPAQVAAREKFKFIHNMLRPLRPFIKVGFRHLATEVMEINLAFSLAYRKVVTGTYPDLVVDYSQLVLSEGRLLPLKEPEMIVDDANKLTISWDADFKAYSSYSDLVMLVTHCPALGLAGGLIGGFERGERNCNFTIPPMMIGQDVDVYISLFAVNGKEASNSQYMGRVRPV